MAAKNQVTLTFAGDTQKLEQSFGKVNSATKAMADTTETSSKRMGAGFAKFGIALQKDIGFRVDKVHNGLSLLGNFVGGPFGEALQVGVVASDTLSTAMSIVSLQNLKAAASFVATKVATLAAAAATNVMTVAQKALNLALRANPIGLIITALFAVGAALVLAYKKSETFRNIVQGALRGVSAAFRAVVSVAQGVWNAIQRGASALGRAIAGVARAIAAPFRTAFSGIKSAWNATVGGKGFSVPDWVPVIGGREFRIPRLHQGGVMPGAPGSEGLALLQAGERVTPAGRGTGVTLTIQSGGSRMDDMLVELLRRSIRVQGGDVQLVLGS